MYTAHGLVYFALGIYYLPLLVGITVGHSSVQINLLTLTTSRCTLLVGLTVGHSCKALLVLGAGSEVRGLGWQRHESVWQLSALGAALGICWLSGAPNPRKLAVRFGDVNGGNYGCGAAASRAPR